MVEFNYKVVICDFMCVENVRIQFKFPKSKKKRIVKKFSKNPDNYKIIVKHSVFKLGETLYVSTKMSEQLKSILTN